jgi:hypothetical protein
MVRASKLGVAGAVSIPVLMLLVVGISAGFGSWTLMRKWSMMAHHQLRLNRCVGQVALEFRDRLTKLEDLNQRIKVLRGSIRVARFVPSLLPTVPGLELALFASVTQQDFHRLQWRMTQGRWMFPGYCGNSRDQPRQLPSLEFTRGSPDDVGPQALEWKGDQPDVFLFQIKHSSRVAAARVDQDSETSSQGWTARWSTPVMLPGADSL